MNTGIDASLPAVLLFNINGSGMGHMSTCLAYANRLRGRARPVFFSLASAMEFIHALGYEGDYLVSRFWSRASAWDWDRQLALRLGMLLEQVRPDVVVFDGTWPYRGLLHAVRAYGAAKVVWSDLTLYKPGWREVPVKKSHFDLLIRLGEIGSSFEGLACGGTPRQVNIPPLTLLKDEELLDRDAARRELRLEPDKRYALFSLGPGNLKDINSIGRGLVDEVRQRGYHAAWTRAPISVADVALPEDVIPLSAFPVARFINAFDLLIAAAGYNTCCEVLQSGIPTLFVPNTLVSDDQTRRAGLVAEAGHAVVSPCETPEQRSDAVERVTALAATRPAERSQYALDGAERAADEILSLIHRS